MNDLLSVMLIIMIQILRKVAEIQGSINMSSELSNPESESNRMEPCLTIAS